MASLYHALLYQPLYNALIWLYDVLPGRDIGVAIIILTILIRLALLPFSRQALKSQKALQKIQPELEAIKKAHKDDRERQAKEMMALYAREKVNPMASCLPLLVQLPILIALYRVFIAGLHNSSFVDLYSFVQNPGSINPISFGFLNLLAPSIFLAILAGVTQYFQAWQLSRTRPPQPKTQGSKDEDMLAVMNMQMLYFMPILTIVISWKLPAGLALYWATTNIVQVVQQYFVFRDAKAPVVHVDTNSSTPGASQDSNSAK